MSKNLRTAQDICEGIILPPESQPESVMMRRCAGLNQVAILDFVLPLI
tara:strand:- start:44036 stop:44179 length:144 start_codon:yes stop_codon:yes gene_type:complete